MTAPLPLKPRLANRPTPAGSTPAGSLTRPALSGLRSTEPSRVGGRGTPIWHVTVAGTGAMPLLAADALLNLQDPPVRVHLIRPDRPALRPVQNGIRPDPAGALVRRVLGHSRLDVTYGTLDPDEFDVDADAFVRVGTALSAIRRRHPDGAFGAVVTTRELRSFLDGRADGRLARRLPAVRSAVVVGCVDSAAALLSAATRRIRPGGPAELHEVHLLLDRSTLSRPASAAALENLLDLDVNAVVDPEVLESPTSGAGPVHRWRSLTALAELSQRFGSPEAPWLHVSLAGEPIETIGVDALDAVVLGAAGGLDLRTVTAQLLVMPANSLHGTAVDPHPGGACLARAGTASGANYVAAETGFFTRDNRAARRIAHAVVRGTLRGTPTRSPADQSDQAPQGRNNVISPLLRRKQPR